MKRLTKRVNNAAQLVEMENDALPGLIIGSPKFRNSISEAIERLACYEDKEEYKDKHIDDSNKKQIPMHKDVLKDGYKVVFRNGEIGYAVPSANMFALKGSGYYDMNMYDEFLLRTISLNKEYIDVVEIYDYSGRLMCKRKNEYKPSKEEVNLLNMIDSKFKWIARDKAGHIFAFENEPKYLANQFVSILPFTFSPIDAFGNAIKITLEQSPYQFRK